MITSVNETSPAGFVGLKPGMILESIDGKQTSINFYDYAFLSLTIEGSNTENITDYMSHIVLFSLLSQYNPGDTVKINVDGNNYDITLDENPQVSGLAYIGIDSRTNVSDISLFYVAFPLFGMIASLSILVGIFNILPIYPLDGGLIVQAIAERFSKKRYQQITMTITIFVLMILLFTFIAPMLQNL